MKRDRYIFVLPRWPAMFQERGRCYVSKHIRNNVKQARKQIHRRFEKLQYGLCLNCKYSSQASQAARGLRLISGKRRHSRSTGKGGGSIFKGCCKEDAYPVHTARAYMSNSAWCRGMCQQSAGERGQDFVLWGRFLWACCSKFPEPTEAVSERVISAKESFKLQVFFQALGLTSRT